MNIKIVAIQRLEIFPHHITLPCPCFSLNYLPVFTGLYLLFISSLTFSDFTICCQEHGWSFSSVTKITGENLEITWRDWSSLNTFNPRNTRKLHLLAEFSNFCQLFSLCIVKQENRIPNRKWRWEYKSWFVVIWNPCLKLAFWTSQDI